MALGDANNPLAVQGVGDTFPGQLDGEVGPWIATGSITPESSTSIFSGTVGHLRKLTLLPAQGTPVAGQLSLKDGEDNVRFSFWLAADAGPRTLDFGIPGIASFTDVNSMLLVSDATLDGWSFVAEYTDVE